MAVQNIHLLGPWLLVGVSFLVGCSLDPRVNQGIDGELLVYVARFEDLSNRAIGDIPVGFGPMDKGEDAGECMTYYEISGTYREVIIERSWWVANRNDLTREMLIFHELGHCVLDCAHDTTLEEGIPKSVMYPMAGAISPPHYATYREKYFENLLKCATE
jgi:hypothetical protein